MEKRGDRTIEHNTLPWLGGSAKLSVTDRCRDGAVIQPSCASGFPSLVNIAHIRRFNVGDQRRGRNACAY
jgi:hypothetical protein